MKPKKIYADRARELADLIERSPDYDQSTWMHINTADVSNICGTPACVAGHVTAVMKPSLNGTQRFLKEDHQANGMKWLGLDMMEADQMFRGEPDYDDGEDHTPTNADAAAMLRRYADTGEIVWQRCTKSDE